ncbi:patatin-like phospholipase family protein [Bdellovibrio reynosensis]|uniref:Patatin-like phospholipase family protein n=1 Tax=Bdellovibrio reynosensis TaxID=2835041 RepID=A0ABY4CEB3_9BACT|nr:patatin-like phospholipase family protein [Bdellovibrio reynosensis]UOF02011.1 patatin-like phospholipase family protein [Bdellovibrio reynosensis]
MSSLGLVLSGGGAKAAYQAGVISAVADICSDEKIANPFDYYSGLSAGALNTTLLAATPHCHFGEGAKKLADLWSNVQAEQVYVTSPLSLSLGGLQLMADLSLGAFKKNAPRMALLDTSPLKKLINEHCNFTNIQTNIDNKAFKALAISTLDYFTTSTVTFVQGHPEIPMWQRVRRQSERSIITEKHVLASASIPVLFPPVTIDNRHFGDGSIRNQSPCGPAIYMGAQKILAIGVRKKQDLCYSAQQTNHSKPPTVGRVLNVLLHTLMMDGMEIDIERIERINENIEKLTETQRATLSVRPIKYLWICPSREVGEVAADKLQNLPPMIRYLLKGLGSLHDATEIASFLLFEAEYCKQLLQLGFEDGMKQKDQIRRLILD